MACSSANRNWLKWHGGSTQMPHPSIGHAQNQPYQHQTATSMWRVHDLPTRAIQTAKTAAPDHYLGKIQAFWVQTFPEKPALEVAWDHLADVAISRYGWRLLQGRLIIHKEIAKSFYPSQKLGGVL